MAELVELVKSYSRYGDRTVTVVFVKWPSGSGAGVHPAGRVHCGRCAGSVPVLHRWRETHGPSARSPRFPTRPPHDGLARHAASFRPSCGITLYGHKTNGTARLVETRHKPATAAERIPNGKRYQQPPPPTGGDVVSPPSVAHPPIARSTC